VKIFPNIYESPRNSRWKEGDMQQIPCWGPDSTRRHGKSVKRHRDFVWRIYVLPLVSPVMGPVSVLLPTFPYNFDLHYSPPARNWLKAHLSQTRTCTHTGAYKNTSWKEETKRTFGGNTLDFTPKVYFHPADLSVLLELVSFVICVFKC
jgi:hypothetical protein